jgi:hypothetical protein
MKDDLPTHQRSELLRLGLAMRCFKGALELSKHVMKIGLREGDYLYGPCMAGVVVTYARPFSPPAKGIGVLGGSFERFDDPHLKKTHDELIALRKKVFAHHDATDKIQPYVTMLEFGVDKNGTYYIRPDTNVPQVTVDSIPQYSQLLRFQIERVEWATDCIIKSMGSGKKYTLGWYQVGLNFP